MPKKNKLKFVNFGKLFESFIEHMNLLFDRQEKKSDDLCSKILARIKKLDKLNRQVAKNHILIKIKHQKLHEQIYGNSSRITKLEKVIKPA